MKKIRIAAVILTVLMLVTMLTACSGKTDLVGTWTCNLPVSASELMGEDLGERDFTIDYSFDLVMAEKDFSMTAEVDLDKMRTDFINYFDNYLKDAAVEANMDYEQFMPLFLEQMGYESVEALVDGLLIDSISAELENLVLEGTWELDGDVLTLTDSEGAIDVAKVADGKITLDATDEGLPVDTLVFEKN